MTVNDPAQAGAMASDIQKGAEDTADKTKSSVASAVQHAADSVKHAAEATAKSVTNMVQGKETPSQ